MRSPSDAATSWCTSSVNEGHGPHPRDLLTARGFTPKKHLGQHFLMDGGVASRIASLIVRDAPARVIEIGPGTGALTRRLVDLGAAVTAIDVDAEMVEILRDRGDLGAARIVHGDALAFDYSAFAGDEPWTAAGNLPYNIATPLLVRFLQLERPPQRVVAMVQRDVADRLAAKPQTPAYGSLSVFCAFFATVRRAFVVGPQAFYPRPRVESAVVVLERHVTPPIAPRDPAFFLQVVRAGFAYRRKTLANSLSLALAIDRARTQRALAALAIDTEIRAEQLDLVALGALADRLAD